MDELWDGHNLDRIHQNLDRQNNERLERLRRQAVYQQDYFRRTAVGAASPVVWRDSDEPLVTAMQAIFLQWLYDMESVS